MQACHKMATLRTLTDGNSAWLTTWRAAKKFNYQKQLKLLSNRHSCTILLITNKKFSTFQLRDRKTAENKTRRDCGNIGVAISSTELSWFGVKGKLAYILSIVESASRQLRLTGKIWPTGQMQLSYDQLWAASLIGRNAVTWRWTLSYVHRFTVTRDDIIMSPRVTSRSLNANVTYVRYILRRFCLL